MDLDLRLVCRVLLGWRMSYLLGWYHGVCLACLGELLIFHWVLWCCLRWPLRRLIDLSKMQGLCFLFSLIDSRIFWLQQMRLFLVPCPIPQWLPIPFCSSLLPLDFYGPCIIFILRGEWYEREIQVEEDVFQNVWDLLPDQSRMRW